ncbi:MAG: pyridoxamine 5'-phosphate oxidase family protein [Planctomycetota bacterium]
MSEFSLDQQVETFLAVCRTASLATVSESGRPHAANVQYVCDPAWRLYWVSKPDAAHSQHLANNPYAAVTVYAHQDQPDHIHGVQLHGKAAPLAETDRSEVLPLYQSKYPFTTELPYRDAISQQLFYCFTPSWLRWIDNRQGFGFRVERDLPG